jgi:hypothetical protein
MYEHYGNAYVYGESQSPSLSSNIVNDMNAMYHAHPQNDIGIVSFSTPIPSYTPPAPLDPLCNFQPGLTPQPFFPNHNIPYPISPVSALHAPSHHPSTVLAPSLVQLAQVTTPITTSTFTPSQTSTSLTSQRAKFPCPSCGKLCTSRPRANTCFFNHVGVKPFACNGDCGIASWSVLWFLFVELS